MPTEVPDGSVFPHLPADHPKCSHNKNNTTANVLLKRVSWVRYVLGFFFYRSTAVLTNDVGNTNALVNVFIASSPSLSYEREKETLKLKK